MLSVVVLALVAVSVSAYYPRPELQKLWLAKWNPRNTYELEKICELADEESYSYSPYKGIYGGYDDVFDTFTKGRKESYKIRHCCNKISQYEKKECLKDVRENVLDNYCTKSRDHVCCKNEYENRYTCFARYPFSSIDDVYTSPLTSPLYDTIDRYTDRGYECGRTCRQRRRADRYLNRRLGVEGGFDTDYVTDMIDDEEILPIGGTYSYLEDVEDAGRFYGRPDIYSVEGQLKRQMFEEVEDKYYDQVKGRRLMAQEVKAEGIAEVLAQDDYITPFIGGSPTYDTLRKLNEIEGIERTGLMTGPYDSEYRMERILEDREDYEDVDYLKRPCEESPRCQRKVHIATNAGAQRVCTDKIYRSTPKQIESCCKTGSLVGKTAGPKYTNVCLPALFKFAVKTQGCVFNKPACKQTFIQCCRETAELARQGRTFDNILYREDPMEYREEILEDVVSRRPFY